MSLVLNIYDYLVQSAAKLRYFINRSFCWEDTEQGKEYWKKISDSWEERCSTPVKKV